MGSNQNGMLGVPLTEGKGGIVSKPRLIEALLGPVIVDISCGDRHTVVATESGESYSWGSNENGQLGLGTSSAPIVPQPTLVKDLRHTSIKNVSCGARHTIFLSRFKEVFSCGDGEFGQLGTGQNRRENVPKLTTFGSLLNQKQGIK